MNRFYPWKWLENRRIGLNLQSRKTEILPELYSNIKKINSWDPRSTINHTDHGGIFNFDFSLDGSIMVAACERKSFLLFDPLNAKLLSHKNNAHNDCVNCVRFLDSRIFATCSDDTNITIWDVRYLKHKIRTLYGHSNWVKNIEYAEDVGLLVTSGFDGSIYTWDINKYSEKPETSFTRVFHTNGLMRSKLTPDSRKLIVSTAGGYLMIIHNLDLNTLNKDLHGFKPNMYRLMQMSHSPVRQGYLYNQVFERQTNRVEFISDFPQGNEAEVIASLQVHPYGWSVLSRNTSSDENTEWTCFYDVQENLKVAAEDESDEQTDTSPDTSSHNTSSSESDSSSTPSVLNVSNTETINRDDAVQSSPSSSGLNPARGESSGLIPHRGESSGLIPPGGESSSSGRQLNIENQTERGFWSQNPPPLLSGMPIRVISGAESRRLSESSNPSTDQSSSSVVRTRAISISPMGRINNPEVDNSFGASRTSRLQRFHSQRNISTIRSTSGGSSDNNSVTFVIRSGSQVAERTLLLLSNNVAPDGTLPKIHRNLNRLTHYCEEANVGRGFIKEPCFSNDGRLVCSPFGFGTRLLAFDNNCNELCDSLAGIPRKLTEVGTCISHGNVVLTTKFSPTHCMFVSGCLNGNISFHQPVL